MKTQKDLAFENEFETFPDGTPIDGWFYETKVPTLESLGKQYLLTAYGILDDGIQRKFRR